MILVDTGFSQQLIGLHFRLSLSKIINDIDFNFEPKINISKKSYNKDGDETYKDGDGNYKEGDWESDS